MNPYRSFWGSVNREIGLLFLGGLLVTLVMVLVAVQTQARWLKVFSVMSWVGSVSALIALLQKAGFDLFFRVSPEERLGGLIGNPIFLGMFLLLTFFLTLYFALGSAGWKRWFYLLGLPLQLAALFFTLSRGPLIGLIAGLAVFGLGRLLIIRRAGLSRWGLGLAVVLAAVSLFLLWFERAAFARLFQISLADTTLQSRLLAWKILWQAARERTFLGWGLENTTAAFNKFYQPGLAYLGQAETVFDRAHNLFVEQWVANGLVGLVLLLFFVFLFLFLLMRSFHRSRRAGDVLQSLLFLVLLSTGVAYFFSLLTAFDVVTTLLYGMIILGGVIALTAPALPNIFRFNWPKIVPLLVLPILLVIDLRYLVPAFSAGGWAVWALRAEKAQAYEEAYKAYVQAQYHPNPYLYFLLRNFPSFARRYAILLIQDKKLVAAREMAVGGLGILERIKKVDPDNPTVLMDEPILYTVLSYFEPQSFERAQSAFDSLIRANPKREYLYFNWARTLMGVARFDEAKKALDQAAAIQPSPKELEFWRAIWGIQSRQAKGEQILADLRMAVARGVLFFVGDKDVLQQAVAFLAGLPDWPTALYYQKALVNLQPEDVQARINLSEIYKNLGRYDEAAQEARAVARQAPERLEDVKKFLQSIGRSL